MYSPIRSPAILNGEESRPYSKLRAARSSRDAVPESPLCMKAEKRPSTARIPARMPLGVTPLAGIRDIITFHGETVDELERASKEAVDDYLATCAKLGDEPNKPYSGKLTLRIPPSVHAAIATAAETSGKSLNKWVADILDQATHAH